LCGKTFSTSEGPWHETIRQWQLGHTTYSTPGAESFEEIRTRTVPAWDRIVALHRGGRVVIVAHGVVCKVLLLSLLPGLTATNWTSIGKVQNLAVNELVQRPGEPWKALSLLTVPDPIRTPDGNPPGSAA
jgi:broad specificity phosphatase PhoE